jgi:hypothetical protein
VVARWRQLDSAKVQAAWARAIGHNMGTNIGQA